MKKRNAKELLLIQNCINCNQEINKVFFEKTIDEIIDQAVAEERNRIVEMLEKSFDELDKVSQLYPMAIVSWSKKDRTNWILSFTKDSVEGSEKVI